VCFDGAVNTAKVKMLHGILMLRDSLDLDSLFTKAVVAASYLGISYSTLIHCAAGTLCLNEYRRKQGRLVVFFTAQVIAHGARVATSDKCDGYCKQVAERVLRESRAFLKRSK